MKKITMGLLILLFSQIGIAQQPGNALSFDGVNDFVSIPYTVLQNTSSFTFECWVRPTGGSSYRAVVSSRSSGTNTKGFIIYINPSNAWEFWTGSNSTSGWNYLAPNIPVVMNKWTHLAATYNSSVMRFYIDGRLVGSTTASMTSNTTDVLKFGCGDAPGNSFFYTGSIDEIRLWNVARTSAEIKAAMLNTVPITSVNLVSYYDFNQGSASGANSTSTTLFDRTANALNGTLSGFALSGTSSNFVESYAMVVPTIAALTNPSLTGFTANWTPPVVGTVARYLLDVASDSLFTIPIDTYNRLDVGTATSYDVTTSSSCYYRVRAEKASVTGQGMPSGYMGRVGFNYTSLPTEGCIYAADLKDSAYVLIAGNSKLSGVVSYEFRLYKNNELLKTVTTPATYVAGTTTFSTTLALYKGTDKYRIEMYHSDGSTFVKDVSVDNILCTAAIPYSVPKNLWLEKYGAHRAVLKVDQAASAVRVRMLWRRHDVNPASHQLVMVDSITGVAVANVYRNVVTNDLCDIVVGPVNKSTYVLYYLPYTPSYNFGGFGGSYVAQEAVPTPAWVTANNLVSPVAQSALADARVSTIQARTAMDGFFPMELIPTASEKSRYFSINTADYFVFPEDRANKIAMRDQLVYKWTLAAPDTVLSITSARNEYYCYQLGIYANTKAINTVKLKFDDLKTTAGDIIPAAKMTCFNTDGINPSGNKFTKTVNVLQNTVQPMWVGIDVPPNQTPGIYAGYVYVTSTTGTQKKVKINLNVTTDFSTDRGDSILTNYSRLRWLNSTLGIDSLNSKEYTPIQKISDTQYSILGRTITTAPDGMPASVKAWDTEVLNSQVKFIIQTTAGIEVFPPATFKSTVLRDGIVVNKYTLDNANFNIQLTATIEADGYCYFKDSITAKKALSIKDIRLEIPFKPKVGQYLMGFGQNGRAVPAVGDSIVKSWVTTFQSFWAGNPYGGVFCRLLGATYTGPMLNVYAPTPPATWNNAGLGGVKFKNTATGLVVTAYSGARSLTLNQKLVYEYALLITPVKALDTKSQFTNKYYHSLDGGSSNVAIIPSVAYQNLGVKVINFHHANRINPYINYPFITIDSIRNQVNYWHSKGIKVKLYFTIRELTYFVAEMWALRSLGTEILGGGGGGGFPWLQEHLINGYNPQWYSHTDQSVPADASIQNSTGDTRWYNYYVEGLQWLVKNVGIDGIYLDDVAYDRRIIMRIRKAMEAVKPGCMIDLHSNTGYSIGPSTQYAEFFPYVDRLWFGESFNYNNMAPDYWLTEASGIPYGLISDEIYQNVNLQRGMIYGSSSRAPSSNINPDNVWATWNSFGIQDAKMIGYWDSTHVVTTNNANVLATAYQKTGKTLIAVASWNSVAANVTLNVNLTKLDLSATGLKVTIPTITGYQTARTFALSNALSVNPQSGYLILLEGTPLTSDVRNSTSDGTLFAVSPNPVNDVANVSYHQPEYGRTNMSLFDINGKKIVDLISVSQDRGDYLLQFKISGLANGIYILQQYNDRGSNKTLRIIKQ